MDEVTGLGQALINIPAGDIASIAGAVSLVTVTITAMLPDKVKPYAPLALGLAFGTITYFAGYGLTGGVGVLVSAMSANSIYSIGGKNVIAGVGNLVKRN